MADTELSTEQRERCEYLCHALGEDGADIESATALSALLAAYDAQREELAALRAPVGAMKLAERIFKADRERAFADSELIDDLEKVGLPKCWTDFWVDEYDHSIEFGIVSEQFVLPQTVLDYLWSQGFISCWINYGEEKGSLYYHRSTIGGSPSNSHGSKQPQPAEIERLSRRQAELERDWASDTAAWKATNEQMWVNLNAERARAEAAEKVVDAAIVWAFCPSAGGYKEDDSDDRDLSMEGTCEALGEAVRAMLGVDFDTPADRWWTLTEMRAALAQAAAQKEGAHE